MRLRKLLYLLMVEVCVAFCNTSARVVTIDAKAKGTEEYRKNKSSNIQVYSENATSTSIANVTTKDIFVITETVRQTTSTEIAKKATTSTKTVTSQKITNEQNIEKTSEETEDIIQDIENTIQNTEDNNQQNESEITNNNYESDYIVLKEQIIPIVYGVANQGMIDTYDVVQDTGLIRGTNNTYLFGHSNLSFSILDSVNCGEIITINNYGITKNYQVERSELAILSDDECDVNFISDGDNVVYKDYGFPAVILITCANGYPWNYRWIVIAKELE